MAWWSVNSGKPDLRLLAKRLGVAEASYLLETLTNFVCDRVGNAPFEHDLYVMAPCCEPAGLAEHQPITILLVAVADLALFADWPTCRTIHVEHGTDGARILTLME